MLGSRLIFILRGEPYRAVSKGNNHIYTTRPDSPLLRLLKPTTRVTEKLVLLTQHLASRELSQARGHGRVLFDIDGQVEEGFVTGRGLE